MFFVVIFMFPDAKHLKKAVSAEVIKLTLQFLLHPTVGGRKY